MLLSSYLAVKMEFVWRFFNINYRKRRTSSADIRRILTQINMYLGGNVFESIFMPSTNLQTAESFLTPKNSQSHNQSSASPSEITESSRPQSKANGLDASPSPIKGLDGVVFFKIKKTMEDDIVKAFNEMRIRTYSCPNAEQVIRNYNERVINKKSNIQVGDRVKTTNGIIGIVDKVEEDGTIVVLVEILNSVVPFNISMNEVEEKLK